MRSSSTITNREFQFDPNGKIEVLRMGEYPHASGIVQVVDSLALEKIVSNFQNDTRQTNFPGLLVDFDHFSSDLDKPSEAAGWITGLERDGNRLLATVDWSSAGENAVSSGRYRLLSPVFNREELEALGNNRFRPVHLDSAGLTNSPNMKGLAPISNREIDWAAEDEHWAMVRSEAVANRCTMNEAWTRIRNRINAGKDCQSISPREAGEQFSAEVNRIKNRDGGSFENAWNKARLEFPALFNRMSATPEASRQIQPKVSTPNFPQMAATAMRELAHEIEAADCVTFSEAWHRVCNRRRDLMRLSNREASADMWEVLSEQAFEKFASGIQLGPDGKRINIVPDLNSSGKPNKNSTRERFNLSYELFAFREPNLSSRQLWEKVRAEHPAVFWPFVAMTAQ